MADKIKVTIKCVSKKHSSVHSSTDQEFTTAFFDAMEASWGFAYYMEVLIAEAIVNGCFDETGRDLLREFLVHTGCKAGCGVESISHLYQCALEQEKEEE